MRVHATPLTISYKTTSACSHSNSVPTSSAVTMTNSGLFRTIFYIDISDRYENINYQQIIVRSLITISIHISSKRLNTVTFTKTTWLHQTHFIIIQTDRARSRSWQDDEDDEIERLGAEISQLCEEKSEQGQRWLHYLATIKKTDYAAYVNNPASPRSQANQNIHKRGLPCLMSMECCAAHSAQQPLPQTTCTWINHHLCTTLQMLLLMLPRAAYTHTSSTVPAYHAPYSTQQSQQTHVKQTQQMKMK